MKEFAIRLTKGADLKESIENICKNNCIDTAIICSGVGCISSLNLRMAKAKSYLEVNDDFEIVSLTGTISKGKAHIHMAVSNELGECFGGHLQKGCLINTTCELVLGILEDYESIRTFDAQTGYDEIEFRKK